MVVWREHMYPVWSVVVSPVGHYFATGSLDKTARVWTLTAPRSLRVLAGHLSDVNVVKFHPNSLYLASGSDDKTVRLWDISSGTCVRVFSGHTGKITAISMAYD